MQDAEVRDCVDLVSESRVVAGSGCCARCEMQRSEIVVTLFLKPALLLVSKYAAYYGAVIGIDALTLFFQNCFDFSFDWMRPCVLYLLLSKWG
jgi:hypothetical protein